MSSETLPEVLLSLPGAEWLPATHRYPAGVRAPGTWSVERELVGNVLPGSVRARSGLSIGSASASVPQERTGQPLSPWATGSRRVTTGVRAELYATLVDGTRVDLGDWITDPTSGALASGEVSVDLIEHQYVGRREPHRLPFIGFGSQRVVEPSWAVDMLARQCGYYSTPPAAPTALLSVPLTGAIMPEVGTLHDFEQPPFWVTLDDRVRVGGGDQASWDVTWGFGQDGKRVWTEESIYITVDLTFSTVEDDGLGVHFGDPSEITYFPPTILLVGDKFTLSGQTSGGTFTEVAGTFDRGLDPDNPHRHQLHLERILGDEGWAGMRIRGRSSPDAPWGDWVTAPDLQHIYDASTIALSFYHGESVSSASALQVHLDDDPEVWAPQNSCMEMLGDRSTRFFPFLPGDLDAWSGIQEIVAAWAGAAWVDKDGIFQLRNKESLAGVGSLPVTPVDVGMSVEDIAWSIDPGDTADRLVIRHALYDIDETRDERLDAPLLWEAQDAVSIRPGETVKVVAHPDAVGISLAEMPWLPAWHAPSTSDWTHVWAAMPNRDGSGTQPADDALTFRVRTPSPGRVIIEITNRSPQTLYTVDANGNPCIILASHTAAFRFNETAEIEYGLPDSEAANPLEIDLGTYMQFADDAQAISDYIWDRVRQPTWKASSVRVKLDWSRDIGDILELTHERSGLSARALVTKVAYDGSPGEVAQSLDLVLLPPTWGEFDTAWGAGTWTDFDALWAGSTWDEFDDQPLRTE